VQLVVLHDVGHHRASGLAVPGTLGAEHQRVHRRREQELGVGRLALAHRIRARCRHQHGVLAVTPDKLEGRRGVRLNLARAQRSAAQRSAAQSGDAGPGVACAAHTQGTRKRCAWSADLLQNFGGKHDERQRARARLVLPAEHDPSLRLAGRGSLGVNFHLLRGAVGGK